MIYPKKYYKTFVLYQTESLLRMGWTKEAHARTEKGYATGAFDNKAVCWCLVGAIVASADTARKLFKMSCPLPDMMGDMLLCNGNESLHRWNDKQTCVDDVINLLHETKKTY